VAHRDHRHVHHLPAVPGHTTSWRD
jgi:hypothetical protein